MQMRVVISVLAISVAAVGCDGGRKAKTKQRAPAVAKAATPAPPPPQRPPQLPAGSVCCDATVRGDHLVQVASEETCTKLKGSHAAVEACWLPDPPRVSGKDGDKLPAPAPVAPPPPPP